MCKNSFNFLKEIKIFVSLLIPFENHFSEGGLNWQNLFSSFLDIIGH